MAEMTKNEGKQNQKLQKNQVWIREQETGKLKPGKNLMTALGFEKKEQLPQIISVVGGGGKTTTIYQLAEELSEQGLRVLVTTSTHIQCPENGLSALVDHVREVTADMWEGKILTAGKPLIKKDEEYKLSMPDGLGEPEEMERLLNLADVILIEADGAKKKPVKVPGEWEPVIIPQTGLVIACAGLSALGGTFADTCFRFREYGRWLMRKDEDLITPEDLALILMDERGSHKEVQGRYYRVVLNQADGEKELQAAGQILRLLPVTMQKGCAVTAYRK